MGIKGIATVLSSVAIVAGGAIVPAAAAQEEAAAQSAGLWAPDFAAHQTQADCGDYRLGTDGFCVANDSRNGLEVGVKFQSSAALAITGIRIYRVDTGAVKGSLWDANGTLLARGSFPGNGTGWQDMAFAAPVTIAPGVTYVASYFTPATKYAFSYGYFAAAGRTVGPVTALQSTDSDPNGVHCYDDAACGSFPVKGFQSSSYWVTPLWQAAAGTPGTSPTGGPADITAPRVTGGAPARGSKLVKGGGGTRVKVQFSEAMSRDTLTRTTIRLLQGRKATPVKVRLRYDADRERLVVAPRKPLRSATTYRVVVTTAVRDVAGNQLDQVPGRAGLQKATWTFRTR